jgi:lipopolysaccharide export system ATP-binding protein
MMKKESRGSDREDGAFIGQDLTKSFRKRRVVDGVELRVRAGEVVGLLGPNGAGKTTIFYMVIGLIRPERGKICLNGEDITDLPMYVRARKGIGYLPQESSVFRKLTVEENIMAILESLPLSGSEREERLVCLLNELGLEVIRDRKAYSLSGGERRRVEITRALVTSPTFILLDEPFAGIDPIAVTDIQKIIFQLKNKGIGVIITDHNVRETLGICDRAYILNEGRILESGFPEKIAKSKKAREIYLGDSFSLEQNKVSVSMGER